MKRQYTRIPPAVIEAWVSKNFEFKLKKGGAEYHICCPFDNDNEFKFCINPEKGMCHYWRGDDWAGPITKTGRRNCSISRFVMSYRKCSYPAALKELLGTAYNANDHQRPVADDTEAAISLPDGAAPLTGSVDPHATVLIKWLKKRGYTDQSISLYDLHFVAMEVYWLYHEFDELVYWQARSRMHKRFLFPDVPKHFLYGFDTITIPADTITLTEGIFDQHVLGPTALAIGGAVLNDVQVQKIRLLRPKRIILAPDNDAAGIRSTHSNYQRLKHLGLKIYTSLPPSLLYNERRTIKDFNELFTKLHLSLPEIQQLFIKNTRLYRP